MNPTAESRYFIPIKGEKSRMTGAVEMSEQRLREKLATEMFLRHMGIQGVCERVADALLPIIRAHAAEVARTIKLNGGNIPSTVRMRISEALEKME